MVRRQQGADRAIRPKLRSPGAPRFQRHVQVAFWEQIAKGLLPEEAAGAIGVAQAVGARWFHNAGGMPPFDLDYRASVAQWKADMAARRPKAAKLAANSRLHAYVQERLSGQISLPNGTPIAGPTPPRFTGRNKPHRQDRPWSLAWSPQQDQQPAQGRLP